MILLLQQKAKERCDVLSISCLIGEKGAVKVTIGKLENLEESHRKGNEFG